MSKNNVVALICIPTTLIFCIAIASQYIALLYTKEQNNLLGQQLFQQQIVFSQQLSSLVSSSLSFEMQKFSIYIRVMNAYLYKIISGKVQFNNNLKFSFIHLEMMYRQIGDPEIFALYQQSSLLVNDWYHKNITRFEDLDSDAQQILSYMQRASVFWRAIEYENRIIDPLYVRKLHMSDMFQGFEYEGLLYTSGVNTTLESYSYQPACGAGVYSFDPRCRFWYNYTKSQQSITVFPPNLIYSFHPPITATSVCQKLLNPNEEFFSIAAIDIKLETTQQYFQNYANSAQQFFIDPRSQYVLYNSEQIPTKPQQFFNTTEFQYLQDQNEAAQFNTTLTDFYNSQLNKQIQQTNLSSRFSQLLFPYNRNGTQTQVILDPILIYDLLPNYYKTQYSPNKYQLSMLYLQINIISDETLQKQARILEQFFNKFFLSVNIALGIIGVISIILMLFYSLRIYLLLSASVIHLKEVIDQMTSANISSEIFSICSSDYFQSLETQMLFDSFKDIYQILLQSSENFFQENETITLVKLYDNIEFFKQFNNFEAVGITYNNIGAILLSQSHYFQALEMFASSVIYAQYEIQKFCNMFPNSQSAAFLADFAFPEKIYVRRDINKKTSNEQNLKSDYRLQSTKVDMKDNSAANRSSFLSFRQTLQGRGKDNSNEKQSNQPVKDVSKQIKFSQINDQFYEERVQLLSNLYFRKRNYAITLLIFQESYSEMNGDSNMYFFWKELKVLLKEILRVLKLLPFRDFSWVEIKSILLKCEYHLNKQHKSEQILNQCENQLHNKPVKKLNQADESINSSNRAFQVQQIQGESTVLFHSPIKEKIKLLDQLELQEDQDGPKVIMNEKERTFLLEDYSFNKYHKKEKKLLLNNNNVSYHKFINNQNILEAKVPQQYPQINHIFLNTLPILNKQIHDVKLSQKDSYYQDREDLSDVLFLKEEKKGDQSVEGKLHKSIFRYILLNKSKNIFSSPFPLKSKLKQRYKDFESIEHSMNQVNSRFNVFNQNEDNKSAFINQNKREVCQEENQLYTYFSKETMETVLALANTQIQIKKKNFRSAADILTSLLERKRFFASHIPFKILEMIKFIFDQSRVRSKEINSICNKFNKNITMKIGFIISNNNNQNEHKVINSIQLLNEVIRKVLTCNYDQLGIMVANKNHKNIYYCASLLNVTQIKHFTSQIFRDILNITIDDNCYQQYNQNKEHQSENKIQEQLSSNQKYSSSPFYLNQSINERLIINHQKEKVSHIKIEEDLKQEEMSQLQQYLKIEEQKKRNIGKQVGVNIPEYSFKIDRMKGDYDDQTQLQDHSSLNINGSLSGNTLEEEGASQFDENEMFHFCIRKAINQLFSENLQFQHIKAFIENRKSLKNNPNLIKDISFSDSQLNCFQSQQKYIVFCLNKLSIINNKLFLSLCNLLTQLNIQLIILADAYNNNFLEIHPEQSFIFQEKELIRVFYSSDRVASYLTSRRDKFIQDVYPSFIQHF